MLLLSIETSTPTCSVALHLDGQLLGCYETAIERSHSQYLTVMIESLLKHCGYELSALGAVALSRGPGSYTGLRIGSSTAKGLCYALDIPLYTVDTLQAMAAQCIPFMPSEVLLCPMLDARRMEVYTCLYDSSLTALQPMQALVLNPKSFSEILAQQTIVIFGNGAAKFANICTHAHLRYIANVHPSAKTIGQLALTHGHLADVAYFEPFYLKEFVGTSPKKVVAASDPQA
jgi:tRNA threonylcarbamoyladenosine biosynthesis protein TsaB